MATFNFYPVFASPVTGTTAFQASLAATTSTSQLVLGPHTIFAVTFSSATGTVSQGMTIRFGSAAKNQAAAATDFFLPPGIVHILDTGQEFDRIALFNPAAAALLYYIQVLNPRG